MEGPRREDTDELRHLVQGLKRSGIKLTKQRLEILREVAESHSHPDAETVHQRVRERVPTVSLDTVYRTLWLLSDLGLVTALAPPRDRVRFDANTRQHHHFICVSCGRIHDFSSDDLDRLTLPDSVRELGHILSAQMEVRGICTSCARERSVNPDDD